MHSKRNSTNYCIIIVVHIFTNKYGILYRLCQNSVNGNFGETPCNEILSKGRNSISAGFRGTEFCWRRNPILQNSAKHGIIRNSVKNRDGISGGNSDGIPLVTLIKTFGGLSDPFHVVLVWFGFPVLNFRPTRCGLITVWLVMVWFGFNLPWLKVYVWGIFPDFSRFFPIFSAAWFGLLLFGYTWSILRSRCFYR